MNHMNTYEVRVKATIEKQFTIYAESHEDAEREAMELFNPHSGECEDRYTQEVVSCQQMKTYEIRIIETLTRDVVCQVEAESIEEAREKALGGDTLSEETNHLSEEVNERTIWEVEEVKG